MAIFTVNDNPLLNDSRVRFVEEMLVAYEREFGEEGDATGMLKCVAEWAKCNGLKKQ